MEAASSLHIPPAPCAANSMPKAVHFANSATIRLTLAEELLRSTPLSIEQIAERLSYADASSFSQAFKRMTGNTRRLSQDSPTPLGQ